ncbi:motility protein B [mine drainage metagenome]|uniref:Motility protein B n=1 Tax=mine drainage metagenome TaxID=410659 RepID=A0A1J5R087_9ZZZZ
MADENTQPIIVKKIKKGGHGHHGGAWKIAYADFVTAMMAFFLLMWLLGSTSKEQQQAIADYFNNPSAIQGPGGTSTSMIKIGGGKDVTYSEGDTKKGSNPEDKIKKTEETKPEVGQITEDDKQRLLELKKELEKEIDASEALKPFKDQLLIDITKEGLRIQIVDKENRPMFNSGSAVLQAYAVKILNEIGKVINHVPNRISLSGHTDATPYSRSSGAYTNWELSADRSNASRRALVEGGMDVDKVARVVGLSSAVPFDKANPLNPINRRISIIVLNKQTEDAILHDEGKLDETTAEAQSSAAPEPAKMTAAKTSAAPNPKPAAPIVLPNPKPAAPIVLPNLKPAAPAAAPASPKPAASSAALESKPSIVPDLKLALPSVAKPASSAVSPAASSAAAAASAAAASAAAASAAATAQKP